MTTFLYAGWQFGPSLADVLNEARAIARLADYNHLGTTDAERTARVAEYVNQAVEEFLEENPALGIKAATLTFVSGTNSYSLATAASDLHERDILRIEFNAESDGASRELQVIPFVDRAGMVQLPTEWRNGSMTRPYPQYWSFDDDGSNIVFYPTPSDSTRTVSIIYRQRYTAMTAANVATPSTTALGEIPTPFKRLIALRLATMLANPISSQNLGLLGEEYERERARSQRRIAITFASSQPGQSGESRPDRVIDRHGLFAGMAKFNQRNLVR